MRKTLIYAEAQIKNDKLEIVPYNSDDDWSLSLGHGQFVGHNDAVWLVQKRGDDFYFIQISEKDVHTFELNKEVIDTKKGAAVRRKYAKKPGQQFTTGSGYWCHRPDRGDILWVAGQPVCRHRLDVALTLLNHRTKDVKRVSRVNRVVQFDPTRERGTPGQCGALVPRGTGSFSALVRNGKISTEWQRVSNVPWLVSYSLHQGKWHLEIFATPDASFDEIADALIDTCGLHEFDLFAEMLIKERKPRKKRKSTTVVCREDNEHQRSATG